MRERGGRPCILLSKCTVNFAVTVKVDTGVEEKNAPGTIGSVVKEENIVAFLSYVFIFVYVFESLVQVVIPVYTPVYLYLYDI